MEFEERAAIMEYDGGPVSVLRSNFLHLQLLTTVNYGWDTLTTQMKFITQTTCVIINNI